MKIRIIAEIEVDNNRMSEIEDCQEFCEEVEDFIYNMDGVKNYKISWS